MSEPADGDGSKSKPGEDAEAAADDLPKATAVKPGKVGKTAAGKHKVVAAPSPMVSTAHYVKGYEKRPGKLELTDTALLFSTPKKDLAGKVALAGILALALDRFDVLVTVPVGDIIELATEAGTLEVRTAKETLTFAVDDVEPWLTAFAGEGAAPADPFHGAVTYPDDGPLAMKLRRIDNYLGVIEQVVLVALLATVTLTAATHAILERVAHIQLSFKDDVIRGGTFAIAMLGGVFATHQARHLSMDLISRKFSPRNRLYLKVALAFFMFFIVALMIRAGFHTIRIEEGLATRDKLISSVRIAWLIPIGGFLIIVHTFIHTIIDIDYLVRGKTPPERMRSGH
ncbi:MAG: TRAP transporter small permease [Deltaproteobacteria bacterium]|nr:TRAP transporter small permease [Deltaproteobacteria bacterium]